MQRLFALALLLWPGLLCAQQDYFQQEVNHTIEVALDDKAHVLHGHQQFEYVNNSPQTLEFIWLHLWPNAYKNGETALGKQLLSQGNKRLYYASEADRGYIDSLHFTVGGQQVTTIAHPNYIDVCKLPLPSPLPPGGSITVETPFRVKIPKGVFSRLGHIEQQYQITQWYVKPAVFDRDGWHEMPYLSQGEFYSEFGSFDVSITVPRNYVVGATGDLQNQEEIEWLNGLAEATEQRTEFPKDAPVPESRPDTKTLRYLASNVHDFAWFADKSYNLLKGSVTLPHSGRTVTTWAMFNNADAELWKNSITYLNDALHYYSLWNGDYPYNHMTAVDGALSAGAGMEYPNITVVGAGGDTTMLETVIMHETGHNWFYGMLASNERAHPWMDEGLNSMCENRYIETKYPEMKVVNNLSEPLVKMLDLENTSHKTQYEMLYVGAARANLDQPIEFPAAEYSPINYGGIVYGKSALVFDYLMAYLGEETYDKAMQTYFERWKFKHPQPDDFKAVMQEVSGKELNWLFDDLMQTTRTIDYRIVRARTEGSNTTVTIRNSGQVACPVHVALMNGEQILAEKWVDGFEGVQTVTFPVVIYTEARIDPRGDIPELNRHNNIRRNGGLFPKTEPLKLKFAGGLENPEANSTYWFPIMGWNRYNGYMAGLALYNSVFPQRTFDWTLAPMYGVGSNSLAGFANAQYHLRGGKFIREVTFLARAQRFDMGRGTREGTNYTRGTAGMQFHFAKKDANSSISNTLELLSHNVLEHVEVEQNPGEDVFTSDQYGLFNELVYTLENSRAINKWSVNANLRHGIGNMEATDQQFLAASITAEYELDLTSDGKGLDMRFFAGKHLQNNTNNPRYNWRMDGMSGFYDYTYSSLYFGRVQADGLWSQQFVPNMGAFKVPTPVGQSNDWIAALNLELRLPIPLPLSVFADIGTNANGDVAWSGGIGLPIAKNVMEIYVPLFHSSNIRTALDVNNVRFIETIRFHYNLPALNPKRTLTNALE